MITGSHNPAEDNGLKILCGRDSLHGDDITALARWIAPAPAAGPSVGAVTDHDVVPAYLDAAAAAIHLGPRRPRLVLDAGNGAGGPTALALYRRLGFPVEPLYCDYDGRFPHHHPDPTVPANLAALIATVAATGAELGLALDGDADRLGAVDGHRPHPVGRPAHDPPRARRSSAEQPGAALRRRGQVLGRRCTDELRRCRRPGRDVEGRPLAHQGAHEGHRRRAGRRDERATCSSPIATYGFDDAIYAGARLLELLTAARTRRPSRTRPRRLPATVNDARAPGRLPRRVARSPWWPRSPPALRPDPTGGRGWSIVDGVRALVRRRLGPGAGPPTPSRRWWCAARPPTRRAWPRCRTIIEARSPRRERRWRRVSAGVDRGRSSAAATCGWRPWSMAPGSARVRSSPI
jgi:hypothetical protein